MRKSHNVHQTSSLHDPLHLVSQAPESAGRRADTTHSEDHETQVNPLWMITAGLAAFLVLLVAVW